jgi:hypothetical protein
MDLMVGEVSIKRRKASSYKKSFFISKLLSLKL